MPGLLYVVPTLYIFLYHLGILIPTVAHIQLPVAADWYQQARQTLRLQRLQTGVTLNRKEFMKQLKSLRPCSCNAGIGETACFTLKKSTTAFYYSTAIYFVITLLISVSKMIRCVNWQVYNSIMKCKQIFASCKQTWIKPSLYGTVYIVQWLAASSIEINPTTT